MTSRAPRQHAAGNRAGRRRDVVLSLYVSGPTPRSLRAIVNVQALRSEPARPLHARRDRPLADAGIARRAHHRRADAGQELPSPERRFIGRPLGHREGPVRPRPGPEERLAAVPAGDGDNAEDIRGAPPRTRGTDASASGSRGHARGHPQRERRCIGRRQRPRSGTALHPQGSRPRLSHLPRVHQRRRRDADRRRARSLRQRGRRPSSVDRALEPCRRPSASPSTPGRTPALRCPVERARFAAVHGEVRVRGRAGGRPLYLSLRAIEDRGDRRRSSS